MHANNENCSYIQEDIVILLLNKEYIQEDIKMFVEREYSRRYINTALCIEDI